MAKSTGLSAKPNKKAAAKDDFVKGASSSSGEKSRLTVEMPAEMHRQLKAKCAMDGTKLNVVVNNLVEQYLR
jgi:hypothetical protein